MESFLRENLLAEGTGGVLARKSSQSDEQFRLRVLGHPLQQAFERYYIALTILSKSGSGVVTGGELERACHLAAQRLSLLYTPAAPEFFDKTLFRVFIRKAKELRLFWTDDNSKLAFDDSLELWTKDAKALLGRELRQTIEKVSPNVSLSAART